MIIFSQGWFQGNVVICNVTKSWLYLSTTPRKCWMHWKNQCKLLRTASKDPLNMQTSSWFREPSGLPRNASAVPTSRQVPLRYGVYLELLNSSKSSLSKYNSHNTKEHIWWPNSITDDGDLSVVNWNIVIPCLDSRGSVLLIPRLEEVWDWQISFNNAG